jgi:hypothetical protein
MHQVDALENIEWKWDSITVCEFSKLSYTK